MKALTRSLFALLLLGVLSSVAHAWTFKRVYTITTGATTDTTCYQCADSSLVLDTSNLDNMALSIRTDVPCVMAIMIKVLGDSASSTSTFTGSSSTDSTRMVVWPWRTGVISAITTVDSLSFLNSTTLSGATTMGSNELKVSFPLGGTAAANQWSFNYGYWIPLTSTTGYALVAERIQVRWRVLANLSASAPVVKTKISLHGYGSN